MAVIKDPTLTYPLSLTSQASASAMLINSVGDNGSDAATLTSGSSPTTVTAQPIAGINDRQVISIGSNLMGNIKFNSFDLLFNETFDSSVINQQRWLITSATMTALQTAQYGLLINSGLTLASGVGYMVQSQQKFNIFQHATIVCRIRAKVMHNINAAVELGFANSPSAIITGAATTGAFWQYNTNGAVVPVLVYNSARITGYSIRSLLDNENFYTWSVIVEDDEVKFMCQDSSTGLIINQQSINRPITAQRLFSSTQIPCQIKVYTGITLGVSISATIAMITDVIVTQGAMLTNKPLADQYSKFARLGWVNPTSGVQLPIWANSAAPASTTLANAGPGTSGLGGLWQYAAVVGAVTDFVLFGFAVSTTFVCTGIDVEAWVTGAATVSLTKLDWAIGFNAATASCVGTNIVRIPLGSQFIPAASPIGTLATSRISHQFRTPISVGNQKFIIVILRQPIGAATASLIIQGMVNIEGYFE